MTRIIILIFFCIFLFLPLITKFDNNIYLHNHSKFNNVSRLNKYFNSKTDNNIVEAIAKVSQSVVGISVITINDNPPVFEFKDGIFVPYSKDKEIKTQSCH